MFLYIPRRHIGEWGYSCTHFNRGRLRLKCDDTRVETRFRLSAKRTSPLKSAGASVQSITGSRGVRISGSNAGYTMFRGSVKGLPAVDPRFLSCSARSPVNISTALSDLLILHYFLMFRSVRRIAKSDSWLRHVCPSVCLFVCSHGTTRLALDGFS